MKLAIIDVQPNSSSIELQRQADEELDRLEQLDDEVFDYVLVCIKTHKIKEIEIERYIQIANDTQAKILYSDFREEKSDGTLQDHPVIEYQAGAIRDDFDFGAAILIHRDLFIEETDQYSGLYALRLFCQREYGPDSIFHIPEYLYIAKERPKPQRGERQFDYVDPRNVKIQKERETLACDYLSYMDALLPQHTQRIDFKLLETKFDIRITHEASVIIPVRNRERTIADAVRSALSQKARFNYNVIVIDNHSTDGTTEILRRLAEEDERVVHIIPYRHDLGIGGCWNLAIADNRCGRFAVQLDSDDTYKDETTLQQIVDCFWREEVAMVVGSYELTDFEGTPLPPGLIDHREWTEENGPNNALRINGFGAPRAFYAPLMREFGFPNVSYGEDYAVGLRISREYRIGRIYKSLYICRRWEGNSDSQLSQEKINAHNRYKDWLRTIEIEARAQLDKYEL